MRGMVISLLLVVIIVLFSFVTLSTNNANNTNNKIETEKPETLEFSTFTSAVCEYKEEIVNCKDEVFVNCNGKVSKAVDVAECNGIRLDFPKATGAAVFDRNWKDPRI